MLEKTGLEAQSITTGGEEEHSIIAQRDAFFAEIIANNQAEQLEAFSSVASSYLGVPGQTDENVRRSDDVLHVLILFDEVVGLVLDRRDPFNYHNISFHSSELSARGKAALKLALETISSSELA